MSYPCGWVGDVEDRLEQLSEACLWARSAEQVTAGLDAAYELLVEAQAVFLRYLRQADLLRAGSREAASSTSVWLRNRHRAGIRTTHRWVQVAKRIDRAPQVVGEGVASGAVNFDQADAITRALARIPGSVGVDIREQAAAELVRLCAELDADLLAEVELIANYSQQVASEPWTARPLVTTVSGMTPYAQQPHALDTAAWQASWDRQQELYMPDREERIAAMLDTVEAIAENPEPRLLDLAGGTGTITLRALARFPRLRSTVVDLDPVLLTIAEATLLERSLDPADGRTGVVAADLNDPSWAKALPHKPYDAVLTATALHWLAPERLTVLFGEIRDVLRPGGVFINADHLTDDALPTLSERLVARSTARLEALVATGAALSWQSWWQRAAADPVLAPLVEKRAQIYPTGHSAEWNPPATWHLDALRGAGFREAGLVWRGGTDAAVAALK